MKKSTLAIILVVMAFGGYFAYDAKDRWLPILQMFNKEGSIVDKISLAFMEDLKFKDFNKAASYHHPDDQKKVNIPRLIERMFRIKPELLDIMDYNILDTDIDSSGNRARVKLKAKVHILNTDKFKNPELILYFHKKAGKWYMELESSLR